MIVLKKIMSILALFLLLILVGCSQTAVEDSNIKKQAVNYQNLSKVERRKVYFKFHRSLNMRNYDINMSIKNESNRDVRFNLTKFFIENSDDSDLEISSHLNKIIVVEPHSEVTVKNLFEHISKVIFDGPNGYYYLNNNHLLANLK